MPDSQQLPVRIQVLRRLNPIIACMLQSRAHGLASKRLLVLQYRGRKTGQPYSIPLAYVTHAEHIYCVTRNTAWWKSVIAAPSVTLWLRGARTSARADLAPATSADTRTAFMKFLADHPGTATMLYAIRIGSDGAPDARDVDREIHNSHIVRFSVLALRTRAYE